MMSGKRTYPIDQYKLEKLGGSVHDLSESELDSRNQIGANE